METYEASHVVARNVRHIREEIRGIRQVDLAGRLGWSKASLSKLEAGDRRVTVEDLLALAWALEVAPAFLLVPLEDGQLVVRMGGEELHLEPAEAAGWAVGEHSAFTDPRNYYWTVPTSQQTRRNEILRRMEREGLVSFPDSDTVVFHLSGITRTVKRPQEGE